MLELYAFYIFIIFLTLIGIQAVYHMVIFMRLAVYKKQVPANENLPPVSVVICARNEYYNLEKFLPQILEQDYAEFEVVVVNDQSEDESLHLLQQLKLKYPHLSIVDFQQELNFFKGKKFPLSVGIKSAQHDIVLLTDADCYPASKDWIRHFATQFDENTDIVLGYGAYQKHNGLLNQIIRFDTLRIAMLYLSAALWKFTYMGVGRNMAYRKSLFYKHKGFSSHYTIASGDDDLFINKAATRENTKVMLAPGSITYSLPKTKWKEWWKQKQRHISTARYYRFSHKLYLGLWETVSYASVAFFILTLIFPYQFIISLSAFGFMLLLRSGMSIKIMYVLQEKRLAPLSLLSEVFLLILNPLIAFSNLFVKQIRWK